MANGTMDSTSWAKYVNTINNYSDSVSNQPVQWHRLNSHIDRWGEGETKTYDIIELLCLVSYNTFRTWPVDSRTEAGIVDKEYCHIYLNVKYLTDNDWLTASGGFDFNPDYDRFWVNGIQYKPSGDTGAAQANTNPLFQIIILEREEIPTGTPLRP